MTCVAYAWSLLSSDGLRAISWIGVRTFFIAALFLPPIVQSQVVAPAKEAGLDPKVAGALATFGLDFVTGTYSQIESANRSTIDPISAEQIGQQGAYLIDRYRSRVKDAEFGANLLHGAITVGIVSSAVMVGSTGVGAAPAVAMAAIAQAGNNKVKEYIVGDTVAKASAALNRGISAMTAPQREKMDALIKAGRYDEAATHFEASTKMLSSMKAALSGDAEAAKLVDDAISQSLRKGSADAIRIAGQAVANVADLESQFTQHVKGITAFTKKTAASMAAMEKGITDVRKEIGDVQNGMKALADAQSSTALQVQIIQDVLFDQQPASVKLAMLQGGAKPGLTADQRSSLESALKLQVQQQKIVATASTVVGYARDLNTILGNFGVQDERLGQAVRYGTAASTALEQAFSGNYLGAIATVSGLFGSPQPDPVQEQFKRVFAELSKIDKKLDTVIELQLDTLKSIEALSKQMVAMEQRINDRFDRVEFELARLNEAAQVLIWDKLNACGTAWSVQNQPSPGQYDPLEGRFTSFSAAFSYTAAHGDKAFRCHDALSELFYNYRRQNFAGNPLSLSFVRTTIDTLNAPTGVQDGQYGKSALENFRDNLHAPSFRLLERGWRKATESNPGWGNIAGAYALLSTPAASASQLKSRIEVLQASTKANPITACKTGNSLVGTRLKVYLCTDVTTYAEEEAGGRDKQAHDRARTYLADPLVRDQVGTLTQFAMFVSGPRDLAKSGSAPGAYTLNELASRPAPVSYGRPLLADALMISDASIAQQAMIYGDLTAWFIFEQLWDKNAKRFRTTPASDSEKEMFEDSVKMLKNASNPWLQRNVFMLILQSVERSCNESPTSSGCVNRNLLYRLAYERFFPRQSDSSGAVTLAVPSELEQLVAESQLKLLLDVNPEARFVIEDEAVVNGVKVPIPRRVQFQLDGYSLTMPNPKDWAQRRLSYPPFMLERLADRARIAKRMANYSALDGMDSASKSTLLTILSKGNP